MTVHFPWCYIALKYFKIWSIIISIHTLLHFFTARCHATPPSVCRSIVGRTAKQRLRKSSRLKCQVVENCRLLTQSASSLTPYLFAVCQSRPTHSSLFPANFKKWSKMGMENNRSNFKVVRWSRSTRPRSCPGSTRFVTRHASQLSLLPSAAKVWSCSAPGLCINMLLCDPSLTLSALEMSSHILGIWWFGYAWKLVIAVNGYKISK